MQNPGQHTCPLARSTRAPQPQKFEIHSLLEVKVTRIFVILPDHSNVLTSSAYRNLAADTDRK